LSKPIVTTDEVRFVVTRIGDPVPVFQRIFAPTETGSASISVPPFAVTQGGMLLARIDTDTRVNLAGIRFTPKLTYETVDGAPAPTDTNGTRLLTLDLPATAQIYPISATTTALTPWIAPGGPVQVTQIVSGAGPAGFNGRITLAAKSGGVLLVKQPISIVNGGIAGPDRLNVGFDLPAGTPVFFTAEATNPRTPAAFTHGP